MNTIRQLFAIGLLIIFGSSVYSCSENNSSDIESKGSKLPKNIVIKNNSSKYLESLKSNPSFKMIADARSLHIKGDTTTDFEIECSRKIVSATNFKNILCNYIDSSQEVIYFSATLFEFINKSKTTSDSICGLPNSKIREGFVMIKSKELNNIFIHSNKIPYVDLKCMDKPQIVIEYKCGGLCGFSDMYVLEKVKGTNSFRLSGPEIHIDY